MRAFVAIAAAGAMAGLIAAAPAQPAVAAKSMVVPSAVPAAGLPATREAMRQAARARFDRLDHDKDGFVTRDELAARPATGGDHAEMRLVKGTAQRRDLRAKLPEDGAPAAAMIGANFDAIDTDHDGRVSRREAEQAALARFDRADADHDGTLSEAERSGPPPRVLIRRDATARQAMQPR